MFFFGGGGGGGWGRAADEVVVQALAAQQCGPSMNSGVVEICGLRLFDLLAVVPVPTVFHRDIRSFKISKFKSDDLIYTVNFYCFIDLFLFNFNFEN